MSAVGAGEVETAGVWLGGAAAGAATAELRKRVTATGSLRKLNKSAEYVVVGKKATVTQEAAKRAQRSRRLSVPKGDQAFKGNSVREAVFVARG